MSTDLDCPYCGKGLDVFHDDGQGYEEDLNHQMQCRSCRKHFVFTTYVTFSYTPAQADCLNGKRHKWQPTTTYPKRFFMMECQTCGEKRLPTESEKRKVLSKAE